MKKSAVFAVLMLFSAQCWGIEKKETPTNRHQAQTYWRRAQSLSRQSDTAQTLQEQARLLRAAADMADLARNTAHAQDQGLRHRAARRAGAWRQSADRLTNPREQEGLEETQHLGGLTNTIFTDPDPDQREQAETEFYNIIGQRRQERRDVLLENIQATPRETEAIDAYQVRPNRRTLPTCREEAREEYRWFHGDDH